jgi:enolase-phosphatase E1
MISALLTDIEGTTTSLSFVKDVLFPYARARLAEFVRAQGGEPEVRALLDEASALEASPLDDEALIGRLLAWIDEDRKLSPLKGLQGLIWAAGYRNGDFYGHVYPDAARKLREWKARGLSLNAFSSGSVHAQKLLFGHTEFGDLTPLFSAYFDTRLGAKQDSGSYAAIAERIGLDAGRILFLSDVGAELDAARAAGMSVCQVLREGVVPCERHAQAADFDAVEALLEE